jgi:hypothetical protein
MIPFLRGVAVFNAAIWLGALVFFAFVVAPTLLSPEMKGVLTDYWAGHATQAVIARLFWLQHVCGGIALLNLLAEFLYLGKPVGRAILWVLVGMFGLGLLAGFWFQPKLKALHYVKYSARSTPTQKAEAAAAFRAWHGASQVVNLVVLGGIIFYLWRAAFPANALRAMSIPRFNAPG